MKAVFKDYYIHLGLTITYYRKLRGLTQENLADLASLDRLTIAKLETGKVGATLDTIFKISTALEIPPVKLFDFRD